MKKLFILFLFLLSACAPVKKPQEPVVIKPSFRPKATIVLDPGHGGESFGTKSVTKPYYTEKRLTLSCAWKVKTFLEELGYRVWLTRVKDETLSLPKRVQLAKDYKGDLFVSIHFNHAPNPEAHGIEVFYYESEKDLRRTLRSKLLAQEILRETTLRTKALSRGKRKGNFHVIRENSLPAVLVEGGFCSNVREANKLSDPRYLNALAFGIASGIDAFLKKERR